MINIRLIWFLESNGLITNMASGANEVQLIIWPVWKCLFVKLPYRKLPIQHCLFGCTFDPKDRELFARKESAIQSFGIRIQSVLDVNWQRSWYCHSWTSSLVFASSKRLFRSLSLGQERHLISCLQSKLRSNQGWALILYSIHTDGSKDNDRVGFSLLSIIYLLINKGYQVTRLFLQLKLQLLIYPWALLLRVMTIIS